ncbi:phosphatase 2C-like domain-containing protein, partial [Ochromonadaceae sp. CCMP2298]
KINQDRGCVVYPYNGKKDEALFIVLDGHGDQGDLISEFVMRQIVISLEKDPQLNEDPVSALKNAFVQTNAALLVTKINYITSGCTTVAVYVRNNKLWVANVGDSRAVMAYKEGDKMLSKDLSRDHKPDDPEEMARIISWGGFVCPPAEEGLSARVYLDSQFTMIGLAMARSIGDHAVKAVGVIPEPEVMIFDLDPADEFMIMASDGVWEFISSQEAVDIVSKNLHLGYHEACQVLIETAATRWQEEEGDYRDDVSRLLAVFMHTFVFRIRSGASFSIYACSHNLPPSSLIADYRCRLQVPPGVRNSCTSTCRSSRKRTGLELRQNDSRVDFVLL